MLLICFTVLVVCVVICITVYAIKESKLKWADVAMRRNSEAPVFPDDLIAQRISEIDCSENIDDDKKVALIEMIIKR